MTTRAPRAGAIDLLGREAGLGRDLLDRRLATELGRELARARASLRSRWATWAGRRIARAWVGQAALDRLADPQRRVGREAEALAPVELLRGADQAERALLDRGRAAQAQALVAAGDRDDEAQVW